MNHPAATLSRVSIRLGFWSACLIAALFVVFTICFVALALTPPLFTWTTLADYVAFASQHTQLYQNVARFTMLMFGPAFVVLLNSIHDYAPEDKRVLTRISLCFGLGFAVLSGLHYFVQLSAVRLSLVKGQLQGLEQVVQANPWSAISAINLLGWTLFLGLASLFVAPVFSGGRLEKAIRIVFLVNGICCLLGGIGYVFDNVVLLFLAINFGMGGAVLIVAILLCIWYKRMESPSVR